jgi:hypothetical protein
MSPDSTDDRFIRDPELRQLHEALTLPDDAVADGGAAEAEADDGSEERMASLLLPAIRTSMLSPTVRRYVTELLLGGENPTPATRQKLIEAANRGLRSRRANLAALPALLAFKRAEADIPAAELAHELQIPTDSVYRLELGNLDLRGLDAGRIAKWIRIVRADPTTAVSALQHVLELSTTASASRAAGRRRGRQLSDDDQRLINDVRELLRGEGA